ncbi:MAG: hypothetical protein AVDCRST_MAG32-1381, partial [uncultured Nocardioides sp.]
CRATTGPIASSPRGRAGSTWSTSCWIRGFGHRG